MAEVTRSGVPARATRREWIGLAVLTLAALVYAMDLTVLNLAIPIISEELQPTSVQLLWMIDIYGFLVAGLLVTMGTLGDRIGRRRLLLAGAAGFAWRRCSRRSRPDPTCSSPRRAVMGVAGATIAPSTLSLIFTMFLDPEAAVDGHRRVDCRLLGWAVPSVRCSAACSSSSSGGARCSSLACRSWRSCSCWVRAPCPSTAIRMPAGWTSSASRCRCSRSWASSSA